MVHLFIDVALYPGTEYVTLKLCDRYDATVSDTENFVNTGNVSVIRTYKIGRDRLYDRRGIKKGDYVQIWFNRILEKTVVDKSFEKRNTGFELSWHYEDSSEKTLEIEPKKGGTYNHEYVYFINLVVEVVTRHNVSLETLWDVAKKYRLDYIHRKLSDNPPFCEKYDMTRVTSDYIGFFKSALGIYFQTKHLSVTEEQFYRDQLTDSLLFDGFQLWHYIARCEDLDIKSTKTFRTYFDLFKSDSTTAILEAATVINNMNSRQRTNITLEKTSARNLMKKLHSEFGLSIYKLKVLSSTTDNLENIDDEKIRYTLQNCKYNGACEELRKIIQEQGVYVF